MVTVSRLVRTRASRTRDNKGKASTGSETKRAVSPVICGMLIPAGTAHAREIISSTPLILLEFRQVRRGTSRPSSYLSATLLFPFIRALYRSGMVSSKMRELHFLTDLMFKISLYIVARLLQDTITHDDKIRFTLLRFAMKIALSWR